MSRNTETNPNLYVALDLNDQDLNLSLATDLAPVDGNFGFKINQDHFTLWSGYTDEIIKLGKPVFVDTKINNGRRTMGNIVEDIARRGVRHTNVWASAERMMRSLPEIAHRGGADLLAVTVTTHFDEEYCQKVFRRSLPETVRMFTEMALNQGCDGVILPGTTLRAVEDIATTKLVPAVRPDWYDDRGSNDQEQTVTPSEAKQAGADIQVCGGPIYRSLIPKDALRRILDEIDSA